MTYSLQLWPHSAEKDHQVMTGGTLTVDKKVTSSDSGIELYTYTLPLFGGEKSDTSFHRALHSIEHLIAYTKDSGSLRSSLQEISSGTIEGKTILDVSPFRNAQGDFGFRITSLQKLDVSLLQDALKISVQRALAYLQEHHSVPFAEVKKCGQYDFHDVSRAQDLLEWVSPPLSLSQQNFSTPHRFAYVCDLRFLKPKLEGRDDMVMFNPDFSYRISELIEQYLPQKLPDSLVIVGTFGCMTGMYLCVSSEHGDEKDIVSIHAAIIEVLQEHIDISQLREEEKLQYQTLLENYANSTKK